MTTKTRFFLRLLIIIALLPILGWTVITVLLPGYLHYSLLPALAVRAGIENLQVRHLFISPTGAGCGFAIGREDSPAVAVAALNANFNPVALLAGKVDEISVSGLEIHAVFTDNQLSIDDAGLQNLFTRSSRAKNSGAGIEPIQLPMAVQRIAIRQSAFICRTADRVIRMPFAASADLAATGPVRIQLRLFPGGQEIDLTAALDLKEQQAALTFSADNINLRDFTGLIGLPADLRLNARADIAGSADVGLSPFVLSAFKAQLTLHDSSMQFHDIRLSPSTTTQTEPPPISISFSGSRQDIPAPLLFTVTGTLPDLAAPLPGIDLLLAAPSLDITGSVAEEAISMDAVARLRLMAANADLTLEAPAIVLQAATSRQGNDPFHLQGEVTIDGASFAHHPSATRTADGHLTLPFSWPLSTAPKKGQLSLPKIIWQEKDIAALTGTVWLQEKKLGMQADFHSRLLQGLTALLELSADFSGKSGENELKLTIPPAKLTDFAAGRISPPAKDVTLSGLIGGEARLSVTDGELTGSGRLTLQNGDLALAGGESTVSGIELTLTLPSLPQLRSAPAQQLTFTSARIGSLAIDGGSLHFTMESADSFLLEKGDFNWAGGSVNTYALRFAEKQLQPEMIFYCTNLKLASILAQAGIKNVEGDGTVNGRIPVRFSDDKITFAPSFLYSTPGEGGIIRIAGGDFLTQAIPLDSPQFSQLDFAQEALRNFRYNWAKVHLFSDNDTLVMQLNLDGKPASPLPFAHDPATGGLRRIQPESGLGISQPILLDVNFRFPLNTFLDYDKNIKNLLQRAR